MNGLRTVRSRAAAAERQLADERDRREAALRRLHDVERQRDRERVQREVAEMRLTMERRRTRILEGEAADLRLHLAVIVEGAGGEVLIPARSTVAARPLPALAVRRDFDGNVILSTS